MAFQKYIFYHFLDIFFANIFNFQCCGIHLGKYLNIFYFECDIIFPADIGNHLEIYLYMLCCYIIQLILETMLKIFKLFPSVLSLLVQQVQQFLNYKVFKRTVYRFQKRSYFVCFLKTFVLKKRFFFYIANEFFNNESIVFGKKNKNETKKRSLFRQFFLIFLPDFVLLFRLSLLPAYF